MNIGFLFGSSSREIKRHVVESQIHCLFDHVDHLQKKYIQLITSISKFYQCRIRRFYRIMFMFFSICFLVSRIKRQMQLNSWKSLKKMSPKIRYIFVLERKAIFSLIKKKLSVIHTIFNLDFIMRSLTVLSADVCILFSFFFCSLISVSKKRNTEIMLTLPYPYNWQKFNNKVNEKRSQEYQIMDLEYVTGKINSCILELLLRQFFCMIFAPS